MIPRYTRPEMATIWSDITKYNLWISVERVVAVAQHKLNVMTEKDLIAIKKLPHITEEIAEEIKAREQITKHDVAAFIDVMQKHSECGAKYLHYGLTSSDILDTALSIQMRDALSIISKDLCDLCDSLLDKNKEHKDARCMGRTHGMCAEPITFGLKMLRFHDEFQRARMRIEQVLIEISVCKISGPVGTYASVDSRVERHVAEQLGFESEQVASQVIPRDRHAWVMMAMAVTAGSIENLAIEIRHLQRTEVAEVSEGFAPGQKGSSAMPHKRNPILSENLTGLARLIRGYALPALENIALWHERDISHSSVERVIIPDAFMALDFALHRAKEVIDNLCVDKERMQKNLDDSRGKMRSHSLLLYLIDKHGLDRNDAYTIVRSIVQDSVVEEMAEAILEANMSPDEAKYIKNFLKQEGKHE